MSQLIPEPPRKRRRPRVPHRISRLLPTRAIAHFLLMLRELCPLRTELPEHQQKMSYGPGWEQATDTMGHSRAPTLARGFRYQLRHWVTAALFCGSSQSEQQLEVSPSA